MAILTMFELHGDPDEIIAVQDAKIAPEVTRLARENGGISNTVVKTDDGVMMMNLWETEEGMLKVSEQVKPIAQEAGLQQVGWRQYEVLRHRTPSDYPAGD
jgi:hypothetical protein